MRKVLSLILALVLCFGLCACGGENTTENNQITENQEDTLTETNGDNTFLSVVREQHWYTLASESELVTLSDGTCETNYLWFGKWQLEDDIITMEMEESLFGPAKTMQFKIKECNDVYFLIGDCGTFSSLPIDALPKKTIDITLENWADYFELSITPYEWKDAFGEVTSKTQYLSIKLKEEYITSCVLYESQAIFRIHYINSEDDHDAELDVYGGFNNDVEVGFRRTCIGLGVDTIEDVSVTKILGQLVFVEGI